MHKTVESCEVSEYTASTFVRKPSLDLFRLRRLLRRGIITTFVRIVLAAEKPRGRGAVDVMVGWCVGARAAALADARALRVVPAAGAFAGDDAPPRRYAAIMSFAAILPRAAILPPTPCQLRGRSAPREHCSLRACRLPRVFVLNPRAPVLCHCVRSLWCGGLTRRHSKILFSSRPRTVFFDDKELHSGSVVF